MEWTEQIQQNKKQKSGRKTQSNRNTRLRRLNSGWIIVLGEHSKIQIIIKFLIEEAGELFLPFFSASTSTLELSQPWRKVYWLSCSKLESPTKFIYKKISIFPSNIPRL